MATVSAHRTSKWFRLVLSTLLYSILTLTNLSVAYAQGEEGENWATYIAQYDEGPGSVTLNMKLKEKAPLTAFPFAVVTGVVTGQCNEHGFPVPVELKKLYQVDDGVQAVLKLTGQSKHVGSFTYQCERLNYFYVRDTTNVRSKLLELYKRKHSEYKKPYINIKSDPAWNYYLKFLYPNEETRDYMANEQLIQQLKAAGDPLEKPRAVDHWLYFESKKDRDNFIHYATSQGFKVISTDYIEKSALSYQLRLSKEHKVDMIAINKATLQLRKKAAEYNGNYDGWETFVLKK